MTEERTQAELRLEFKLEDIRGRVWVMFWQDTRHKDFTSLRLGGLWYHTEGNINEEDELWDFLTQILYFDFHPDELEFDTDQTFDPHIILGRDTIETMYYRRQTLSQELCNLSNN